MIAHAWAAPKEPESGPDRVQAAAMEDVIRRVVDKRLRGHAVSPFLMWMRRSA